MNVPRATRKPNLAPKTTEGGPSGNRSGPLREVLLDLDRLDANDLRNLFLQPNLDMVSQGELGHRAAGACALEAHLDDAFDDVH